MMDVMTLPGAAPMEHSAVREFDFDTWMLGEQRRVFLLCFRMLRDRDEADMASQDAFLKAYRSFENPGAAAIDDPSKWVTRIAVNTCLDRLRSRSWKFWKRRPAPADEEIILAMTSSPAPSPEDRAHAVEIGVRLQRALAKLSDRQRVVFVLKHFEDRKLEEIAEVLGVSVGAVKAHMARAVARLREDLRDLYQERQR
jgi:RNA polymerase sigma-70 factor (ECF subfamily)